MNQGRLNAWNRTPGLAVVLAAFVGGVMLTGSLSAPARATTVEAVDLEQMTARADLVVIGWVARVESVREDNGRVNTYVTLEGLDIVHGTHLERELELRFSGGELDGERQQFLGMPTFTVGERVLLFVQGNGSQLCPLVGWQQGRFNVVTDTATAKDYLTDGEGNPVVGILEGTTIRYGARRGTVTGSASAGVPDDSAAVVLSQSHTESRPTARLPLSEFIAAVDRLRGVPSDTSGALPSTPTSDGVPVDALDPKAKGESRAPVLSGAELPAASADSVPGSEED